MRHGNNVWKLKRNTSHRRALLRNMDRLLTQVTGIPCHVAENALNSVAVGTGLALEQYTTFRKSLVSSA